MKTNKAYLNFMIYYSRYNGVLIVGSGKMGIIINRYYKNDKLEQLILRLFQQPGADKNIQPEK
jgi:hypothetical protein